MKHIVPAKRPDQIEYEIIIPAAGMGRRMKSYGPKPLINIRDDVTIIQNQLKIIHNTFAKYKIILVSGFQADRLMAAVPDNIVKMENENYEETNVVRSIGIGLRATLGDHIIIIYGDLVFNQPAIDFHFTESSLVVDTENQMSVEEVGCTITHDYVEDLTYDLPNKWGQIIYVTGKELRLLKKFCWNRENSKMFGFEAINEIINRGGKFKALNSKHAMIIDVDTSKDIMRAKSIL